ncbi:MAG: hypothetical protein EPO26_18610 [Chloroflexota bacterium]|nr:MAG: hypothetical protein EPO26_18610 [Chloroflexota bacterium]
MIARQEQRAGEELFVDFPARRCPSSNCGLARSLHNLQSALDHLVWRPSEDHSGPNDADTATQFPIFWTGNGYQPHGINRIRRVGPGAAVVIGLLQPFHEQEPRGHSLLFVRKRDNGDKHRALAITAGAATATLTASTTRMAHAARSI